MARSLVPACQKPIAVSPERASMRSRIGISTANGVKCPAREFLEIGDAKARK